METHSIYSPGPDASKAGIKEKICIYAGELQKCEDLLTIGWVYSNGQHIATRADWLSKEIARLEDQVKHSRTIANLEDTLRMSMIRMFSRRVK